MGADRKGPLAAFVVVAVIAVILLVTSVRSQAAPGWIQGRFPASIVAVVPPAAAPDVWGAVGDGVDQAVAQGVVLVHRATEDPTTTTGASVATVEPAATGAVASPHTPVTTVTTVTSGGPATQSASAPGTRTRSSQAPAPHTTALADPTTHGHGRHLGLGHEHHGHTHAHGTHGHAHGPHGLHLGWARGS